MDLLKTGNAERDVNVLPHRESQDRGSCVWIMLTSVHGLNKFSAKWKVLSDSLLTDIGCFRETTVLPQFFVRMIDAQLVAIIGRKVDNLLLASTPAVASTIISAISTRVKLGKISHGAKQL